MSTLRDRETEEIKNLQKWAKNNYIPGTVINPMWNRMIKAECKRMNTRKYLIDEYSGEFDIEIVLDSNPASRNQVESFAQQEIEEQPEDTLF